MAMESPVSTAPLLDNDHNNTVKAARKAIPPARPTGPSTRSGTGHGNSRNTYYEYEDTIIMNFIKRMFANANLIAMFANTLLSINSTSAQVSLIDVSYNTYMYSFCDYGANGEPTALLAQCSYETAPGYIAFMTIWCAYYGLFFTTNYMYTNRYEAHDLRFYISCDQFKALTINKILIGLGIILSLVSGFGALSYVIHNGTTSAIGNIFVFVGVNIYNLVMMANGQFEVLKGVNPYIINTLFPDPIYINTYALSDAGNAYGVVLTHRALFSGINDAVYASISNGNIEKLSAIGDPVQLRDFADTMNPLVGRQALNPV